MMLFSWSDSRRLSSSLSFHILMLQQVFLTLKDAENDKYNSKRKIFDLIGSGHAAPFSEEQKLGVWMTV